MEDPLVIAFLFGKWFAALRIIVTVAAFVVATAAILYCGGPVWLAVGIGIIAGGATYAALGYLKPPEPEPPKPVITYEYKISIDFSPGDPHTVPYECNIHNTETVTTTQGGKSSAEHSSKVKKIHATNGKEFEAQFNMYLREELKSKLSEKHKLRSVTIYEDPFPGETPLDMMYNACKDQFPKEQFPEFELHTTQEKYHE